MIKFLKMCLYSGAVLLPIVVVPYMRQEGLVEELVILLLAWLVAVIVTIKIGERYEFNRSNSDRDSKR